MMNSTSIIRYGILLLVAVALVVESTEASKSRPPRNNDINTMADALKYLQDLDSFYGDRSRVRYGKRASIAQLLRDRLLESTSTNGNSNNNNNNNADVIGFAELSPAEQPF